MGINARGADPLVVPAFHSLLVRGAGRQASEWELWERRERKEEREAEAEELGAAGELGAGEELPLFLHAPSFMAPADEE